MINPKYRPDCRHLTPEIITMVEKKLRDVEAYRRSRMLPFTPLIAAKMTSVPDWRDALMDMVDESTTTMFNPDVLKDLKIRINIDTSWSMRGTKLTNNNQPKKKSLWSRSVGQRGPAIYANELAGILGAAIYKNANKDSSIWAVATDYKQVPVKTLKPFELSKEIMKTDVGWGTYFEQTMKNYDGEDIYILITDYEPLTTLRKPGLQLRESLDQS